MYRFIEALRFNQDEELNSILDRDLIRYREFIKYSHDKMKKYDSALQNTLEDVVYQLETTNLNSNKAYDKVRIKKIKKRCEDALFWFTKSKELLTTICNYANMSRYEEQDVTSFKNATQIINIIAIKNLKSEYKVGEPVKNIEIQIMNLGYDINRDITIVCSIKNADLGINISSNTNISTRIERMETMDIELSSVDSPKQQCRAYFSVDIYNQNKEVISSYSIKEVFFRKEGN